MYELRIYKKAQREIKKISRLHQINLVSALQDIMADPYAGKPLTRELSGRFSYKIGVYRIIYKINENNKTIHILTAGHRATIYS